MKITKTDSWNGVNQTNTYYFSLNIHDLQISNDSNTDLLQILPRATTIGQG